METLDRKKNRPICSRPIRTVQYALRAMLHDYINEQLTKANKILLSLVHYQSICKLLRKSKSDVLPPLNSIELTIFSVMELTLY